jgi:molybdopterin converting factor small subunit
MSQITVRIPTPLRSHTGGAKEIAVVGTTVGEVLEAVAARHEGLRRYLLDPAGEVRRFVNVYLGERNIQTLDGLATPVGDAAVIHIVPAVAGGAS